MFFFPQEKFTTPKGAQPFDNEGDGFVVRRGGFYGTLLRKRDEREREFDIDIGGCFGYAKLSRYDLEEFDSSVIRTFEGHH